MYTPRTFKVVDRPHFSELIDEYGFATLCTHTSEGILATHLPLMLERRDEGDVLVGHVARANPHWRHFTEGESLAVFVGPHAYISPSWYTSAREVPTWNYAAVHAYGTPRIVEHRGVLREQVEHLTAKYEHRFEEPWEMDNVAGLEDQLFRALVGFEMPISRWEGKWKFNQNRSRDDRIGVIAALQQSPDQLARAAAVVMEQQLLEEVGHGDVFPPELPSRRP